MRGRPKPCNALFALGIFVVLRDRKAFADKTDQRLARREVEVLESAVIVAGDLSHLALLLLLVGIDQIAKTGRN